MGTAEKPCKKCRKSLQLVEISRLQFNFHDDYYVEVFQFDSIFDLILSDTPRCEMGPAESEPHCVGVVFAAIEVQASEPRTPGQVHRRRARQEAAAGKAHSLELLAVCQALSGDVRHITASRKADVFELRAVLREVFRGQVR